MAVNNLNQTDDDQQAEPETTVEGQPPFVPETPPELTLEEDLELTRKENIYLRERLHEWVQISKRLQAELQAARELLSFLQEHSGKQTD
jgi:hypothetical protein